MDRNALMKAAMGRVVSGMGAKAKQVKRDKFMPQQQPLVGMMREQAPGMAAAAGMPGEPDGDEGPGAMKGMQAGLGAPPGDDMPGMMAKQGPDIAAENSLSDEELAEILRGAQ